MSIDSHQPPRSGTGPRPDRFPLRLALTYGAVAALWIATSSTLASDLAPPGMLAFVEVVKGVLFVMVTASLLYVLAWRFVHQRRRSEEALVTSESRFRLLAERSPDLIYRYRLLPDRGFEHVSPAALEMTGYTPEEHYADPDLGLKLVHPEDLALLEATCSGAVEPATPIVLRWRRKDGSILWTEQRNVQIRDASGNVIAIEGVARDVTARRTAEVERAQPATAVEQAAESIIITDPDGSIAYVNPAFERIYGYRRDEVASMNPRLLKSGRHGEPFYRAMWATITGGRTWSGRLTNRCKDGSLSEHETVISPVRDDDGRIVNFIGIQRDVTRELEIERELERETRLRSDLIEALDRLRALDGLDEIAAGICEEALALPEVDMAAVVSFTTPGVAVPIAVRVPPGVSIAAGQPIAPIRAADLRDRASRGPWFETWAPGDDQGAFGTALAEAGVQALAFAPLRSGRRLLGLIAVASSSPSGAADLARHLPQITEFASAAGALLTPGLEADRRLGEVRDRVLATIAGRAFHPVFQPVVELAGGRIVGYEALTRFHDGTRPDHWFRDAHAVGLGIDLELACLHSAREAAEGLPARRWLGLNTSPELILAHHPLGDLLAGTGRPVMLEVTEHAAVDDYEALRQAWSAIGGDVHLCVDDAGAGFASLRHIVELRPEYVKLDIGLVRNIDRDPARQSLIAGMRYFALKTGCQLIAEGVETEAEAATLRSLAIDLGQGYLFARPVPLDELEDPVAEVTVVTAQPGRLRRP